MPLHHYVPQFLLRGFADKDNQLRATLRSNLQTSHLTAVRKAAAERDFYTIPTEELTPESRRGHNPESVEKSLADIESRASSDIRLIVAGGSPYTTALRYRMATLVAMQLTRSPRFRRDYVGVANLSARALLERKLTDDRLRQHLSDHGRPTSPEDVARFRKEVFEGEYKLVPSTTHLVQETLKFGIETLSPLMFSRTPRVLRFSEPLLLTSDVGAAPWSPNDPIPWSNGIAKAHTIFLPLNRFTALALTRGGSPSDRIVQSIWADHSNFALANAAERWIYQHPDDSSLDRIDLPQLQHDRWGRR
ncbi:hypothetical protein SRABI83_00902 [Arthrobacter sp. Bi83]|nr:hypothetical protein SRABI83_00902 [Arthrobacter sp. Bi83]